MSEPADGREGSVETPLRVPLPGVWPARLLDFYRRTGADLPFGEPLHGHGVHMEGYYWRLTDPTAGRVVAVLCGVCTAPDGRWAVVGLAAHPGGVVRSAVTPSATDDPRALRVCAGDVLRAHEDELVVRLDGVRLSVRFASPQFWPRRAFGGLGAVQVVPHLPQYWHPHMLGARVTGELALDGRTVALDGATAYGEKNWGRVFHRPWWWGQAHGFEDPGACVAFAGGRLRLAGVTMAPTAVVACFGGRTLRLVPPLARTVTAVGRGGWRVRAASAVHSVELEGEPGAAAVLPVPVPSERRVFPGSFQVLAGRLAVVVRRGRRTVWRGESALAGLERPNE